jgi:hypothetical protein
MDTAKLVTVTGQGRYAGQYFYVNPDMITHVHETSNSWAIGVQGRPEELLVSKEEFDKLCPGMGEARLKARLAHEAELKKQELAAEAAVAEKAAISAQKAADQAKKDAAAAKAEADAKVVTPPQVEKKVA